MSLMNFLTSAAAAALLAAFAAVGLSQGAAALETKPFEAAAFKAAQDAGKPLLVDVFAPWCPTCKAQRKILKSLESKPEYSDITIFEVDFDNQPEALVSFSATQQSTLIGFKGAKETGRSVGSTATDAIEALLASTLK